MDQAAVDAGLVEPVFQANRMAVRGKHEPAYLTWRRAGNTENGGKIMEIEVIGHSDTGAALADHVAEEIRVWGEQHRNRPVSFEIHQDGAGDPTARRFVLDRPHHDLAVIWR